jgi:hypothetical protein
MISHTEWNVPKDHVGNLLDLSSPVVALPPRLYTIERRGVAFEAYVAAIRNDTTDRPIAWYGQEMKRRSALILL